MPIVRKGDTEFADAMTCYGLYNSNRQIPPLVFVECEYYTHQWQGRGAGGVYGRAEGEVSINGNRGGRGGSGTTQAQ